MRKLILLTISLHICLLMTANPIGRKAAQQKAQRFTHANKEMQLVAQAEGENPAYYVFNAKDNKGGFVIISGDDRTEEVLGYADNGMFDPEDIPENMRWWLDCYREQIERIRLGLGSPAPASPAKEPVEPLVTTLWDQGSPYNLQCPKYNNKRCVTGCVATAMAQILKYWGSGNETPSVPAYTTYSYQISVSALPATTFNWDIMADQYNSNQTDASAQEVAKLMRYCGQVVEMDYSPYGSGSSVIPGDFINYFGFDRGAMSHNRSNYNSVEWEELVYNELKEMRPLYYEGLNISGGHAFVCDGYDGAGYYHINWGWSGGSNGYFKLSVMNPEDKGAGGGTSEDGYTLRQYIITGLIPDKGNESTNLMSVDYLSADKEVYTRSGSNYDFKLKITGSYYNQSSQTCTYELGFSVYKDGELKKTISGYSTSDLGPGWGYNSYTMNLNFGKYYSDGKYRLVAVCRESGTTEWKEDIGANAHYIDLELTGNSLQAEVINSDFVNLQLNDFNIEGIMKPNEGITVRANITNNGTAFVVPLALKLDDENVSEVNLMVDPGMTDDVELHFPAPAVGDHTLYLIVKDDNNPVILAQRTITIEERKNMDLSAERPNPVGIDPFAESVPGTTLHMRSAITNNEREDFDDILDVWLFKYDPSSGYYQYTTKKRQLVFIPAKRTVDVDFIFEDLEDGEKYLIVVYDPMGKELAESWGYMMDASATGIEVLTPNPSRKGREEIYDLLGRTVGNRSEVRGNRSEFRIQNSELKRGLYIINGKKVVIK